MIETFLVTYYLHHFQQVRERNMLLPRPDETPRYIQSVQPSGELTVNAEAAGSASVPPGASRVEMLRLRLTASCTADVPIRTISVQRRGLGSREDITGVYAMHRGQRISTARTIGNRDGSVDLNVRNVRIAACDTEDILILADFSPDASPAGEHSFELTGVEANGSSVRIEHRVGDFTRAYQPRRTARNAVGQLSIDYLTLNERVRFGSRQMLQRITISADHKDDHLLKSVMFTNNGSASDDDLQNIFLEFRNRRVTNVAPTMTGDTVRLVFDPPYRIEKNQTLKFTLRGDVRASRSRTIQFRIEEESDLAATPNRGR